MIGKNGKSISVMDVTAETYACPKGEEHLFHVKIENRQFDERTGERKSHPRIQKFGRKAFRSTMYSALKRAGYTIEILHDADEWAKEHNLVKTERKKVVTDEFKEQLRKELKEELRAELMAEMTAAKPATEPEPEPEPATEPEPEPEPEAKPRKTGRKKAEPEPEPEPEIPGSEITEE